MLDNADFEEWKKQEEDAVVARFVKVRGDYKKTNGTNTKAFYCHRSGRYTRLQHQPRRYIKIQGSCKTGIVCPAAMIAKILPTGSNFFLFVTVLNIGKLKDFL